MTVLTSYPINPRHVLLAPTRRAKPRVVPPSPDLPRPTSAQITQVAQIIADTKWVEMLEPLMPYARRVASGRHKGGRRPEMTVKALLTGCLMLAVMERPMLVRDVWRLLAFGLDAGSRKHLGLDPKREITERMVSYHFNLICAAIDPGVHSEANAELFDAERVKAFLGVEDGGELDPYEHAAWIDEMLRGKEVLLDQFVRQGLIATHPQDSEHEGDYSLDGTHVSSWEAAKRTRRRISYVDKNGVSRRRAARPHEMSDPDATWWSKGAEAGIGYLVTAVTWMEKDCGVNRRGPDIPYLIEHLSVKTANTNGQVEGARVIESMIAHHEVEDSAAGKADRLRGDITADREYSNAKEWLWRMHVVGLTPHFLLASPQLGFTSTLKSGAIIVDGIAYSPGMPESLRYSMTPVLFATRDDRASVAAFNSQREPFRIKANGGARQADGSIKFYCPASNLAKGSISCLNKASSKVGSPTRIQIGSAMPVIVNSPKPPICTQSSVTVPFDQIPYWQPYIPGSAEHQWSVNRRNLVESAFSRIKDEATQSVRRGTFRVMGRAKVSAVVLFNAMASNLLEVARWRLRKAGEFALSPDREVMVRTPRRHTRNRIIAANRRARAATDREARKALEEMGLTVDLETGEILGIAEAPPA